MTTDEKERVIMQLVATAEVMGHELKPATALVMADDLAEYGFQPVMMALTRCRKELTGRLTLKAILDILAPTGGWLSANEAWSRALPATDERNTVIWTVEARKAWFVALPLIEAGDKVGARMAFIAAYDRHVAEAKNTGARPQHEVSPGEDALKREAAISQAQTEGLLPEPKRDDSVKMLPDGRVVALPVLTAQEEEANRQRIGQGLRELAKSLTITAKQAALDREEARIERKREVNRRFDEQRAAALAAIEQHEEKEV